nr:MAG TPA: hypothetical protein [Caudoviricetes sp.]
MRIDILDTIFYNNSKRIFSKNNKNFLFCCSFSNSPT